MVHNMNVGEIKNAVRQLSVSERRDVGRYILELETAEIPDDLRRLSKVISDEVDRVKQVVMEEVDKLRGKK